MGKVQRLSYESANSAVDAVVGKCLQLAAEALVPGSGVAVKAVYLAAGMADGTLSFLKGRGFETKVSVVDIGGGYSVGVRIRSCEAELAPTPRLGPAIDWESGVKPLDAVAVEGPAEGGYDAVEVPVEVNASRVTAERFDMEALVRRAAERFRAAGVRGESWHQFVVAYLEPTSRTGWIVIGSEAGPAYCPAWFQVDAQRRLFNRPTTSA
jgi:hypothetical protein